MVSTDGRDGRTMAKRAVIIGTGAGGLATAGFLAKQGWNVLALEQSSHLGGYLNPFSRKDFLFDPGVHYVGEIGEGGRLGALLSGLGVDVPNAFRELEPDGFDVYRFPGFEVRVCRGIDSYRERLAQIYPAERRRLGRFFELAFAMNRSLRALSPGNSVSERLRGTARLPSLLRWQRTTYGDILAKNIGNSHLRAILAGAGGDYGLPPSRASALVGVGTLLHYANGAFFPHGGSGALRDQIVATARQHGAQFRTEASVQSITVKENRAIGVELEDGERIAADAVISNADPTVTLGKLLNPSLVPAALLRKVQRTEPSMSVFAVYLGMRRDLRRHGLGAFQVWDFPAWDIDAMYAYLQAGQCPSEPVLFLSPNSLKDDPGVLAPEGSSTLEIMTGMPYSLFERFRERPLGNRGEDYQRVKDRMTEWVLESVERRWPGLVGDVVVREVSSPLTSESYTRAVRGGAYGPAMTPSQYGLRRFRTTTPVSNLFLAGAGVFGDGILPCIESGWQAALAAERRMVRRRAFIGSARTAMNRVASSS
jgi:phytoene dehydrogenase-like protein